MESIWDSASEHNNPSDVREADLGKKYEDLYNEIESYYNKIDTLNDNLVNNLLQAWLNADATTPVANLSNYDY